MKNYRFSPKNQFPLKSICGRNLAKMRMH